MNKIFCPKCNSEVHNNDIRCSHCGMRLKTVCPRCETLNNFGSEKCSNCGKILIKYCDNCGTANVPTSTFCRKCQKPFEKPIIDFNDKNELAGNTENVFQPELKAEEPQSSVVIEKIQNKFSNAGLNQNVDEESTEESVVESDYEEIKNIDDEFSDYEEEINDNDISEEDDDIEENIFEENEHVEEAADISVEPIDIRNSQDEMTFEQIKSATVVEEPDFLVDNTSQEDVLTFAEDEDIKDFSEAQDLLNYLSISIEKPDKSVIAICGEEGMGKTTILNAVFNSLSQKQIMGLYSECSELTKIAPYGCIRNFLLRVLSLPDFHPNMSSFFSDKSKQLFSSNFPSLSSQEIVDFMNFLYPSINGDFKDLSNNKIKTYILLEKVFDSIFSRNNIIFAIDNFNLIDSSSYDFINHLIKINKINSKVKLIVTYHEHKAARYYFDENLINATTIFETLSINNMNEIQVSKLVQNFVNTENIPQEVLSVINTNGRGNIFFTEQYLALLFDVGYISVNQNLMSFNTAEHLPYAPNNIEEILKERLNVIQVNELKESLYTASVLGYKFDRNIFGEVMEFSPEETDSILKKLSELMYIQQSGQFEFSFKNMTSWNVIFDEAQTVPNFKPLCKKIYYTMGKYGLSNVTVKATIAKQRDEAETAFQSWKTAADTAAYLGDEYVYTVCSEQWLIASGYSETSEQVNEAQIEVLENLGKIYTFEKPESASKYLVNPILYAQKQHNIPKMIELSAYMIKACDNNGNYNGIIETIDKIISSAQEIQPVDKAIILSKKMQALFFLGNCEEAINLANNDLLPVLENELSKNNESEQMEEMFSIWFDVSMWLANTYSLQGNTQSMPHIANIEETLKMNNIQNNEYLIRLKLGKAFAQVVLGNVNDCFATLNELKEIDFNSYKNYKSQYNLILSFAKIITGQSENLKQKLFEYAMYSDNNYDTFGKHMFKLMFAKLLLTSGDYQKSIEIFNEELNFFAKEKIVTGALISWMYISKINLLTGTVEAAENMALKALEVAQNPKFSQYHISVYLQKLIAEINISKGDFDVAKMYIEKGMLIAKQFGLELSKIELYKLYIQLLQQIFVNPEVDKLEVINKINQLYKMILTSAKNINSTVIVSEVQKDYSEFLNYCQQNSINLQ